MHIYMSRHGESVNNTLNIIGGDCNITDKGKEYGKILGKYFANTTLDVYTSKLKRTKETASFITSNPIELSDLNEIHSGDFEGLLLDDIITNFPDLYEIRNKDKLNNRYPNGENYNDLYNRVIVALDTISKNNTKILIIAHQAVCRVIYSYFTKTPLSECIDVKIDLHSLYELKEQEFIHIL